MQALAVTLPIFALIAAGALGARLGLLPREAGDGLSRFVFWFAFPALLLTSVANAPPPRGQDGLVLLVWGGVLLAMLMATHLLAQAVLRDRATAAAIALGSVNGNTAFLGMAVIGAALGPEALAIAAALVAVENVLATSLGAMNLRLAGARGRSGGASVALREAVRLGLFNPVSVGALAGMALSLGGVGLWAPLERPLVLLGQAASPCGLVALGVVLAHGGGAVKRQDIGAIALGVALKCAVLPLLMATAMNVAGAPREATAVAVILAACPSAVNVFIQARQAGVWTEGAARLVLASTLASVVGVTVALASTVAWASGS